MKYLIALNDDSRGRDRIIYITSWGTSVWVQHAKEFDKEEAELELKKFLENNDDIKTGFLINEQLKQTT